MSKEAPISKSRLKNKAKQHGESLLFAREDAGEGKAGKGSDPDVIRTRSLLIWSQTRYHCATRSGMRGVPLKPHPMPLVSWPKDAPLGKGIFDLMKEWEHHCQVIC